MLYKGGTVRKTAVGCGCIPPPALFKAPAKFLSGADGLRLRRIVLYKAKISRFFESNNVGSTEFIGY
jgi:hypothetical protein